jgi:hypothetical protein
MKSVEQIKNQLKGTIEQEGEDGLTGIFYTQGIGFRYIFSYGGDWEHVSISILYNRGTPKRLFRCPTWEEMCMFKEIFWRDDEIVMQLHLAKKDYVNNVNHCLHLWRPMKENVPTPPKIFV